MDLLSEYIEENCLSKASILKYVDEYSIYSFYIGTELELYTKYSSPLRLGDADPSFSLYYSKYIEDKLLFKDQSTGKFGGVFDFIALLLGGGLVPVPLKRALLQVNSDFCLGLNDEEVGEFKPNLVKTKPLKKNPVKIEVTLAKKETKEYLNYWEFLEISEKTRDKYFFGCVDVVHYKGDDGHVSIVVKSMTTSYEIVGHYKVYQPGEDRRYKFRNDYLDVFVEGAMQLDNEFDFIIITKSMKECAFLDEHFGWDAVAGKSENTMINPYFMENTVKKYKKAFIWLDPDEAGANAQQRYLDMYPWLEPLKFDDFVVQKDPTDLFTVYKSCGKREMALAYLKQLVKSKL